MPTSSSYIEARFGALRPFLRRVRRAFPGATVLLFGSHARDDALKDSDFDLLILWDGFAKFPIYRRHVLASELDDGKLDLDLICLTPTEYESRKRKLTMLAAAARDAVRVA